MALSLLFAADLLYSGYQKYNNYIAGHPWIGDAHGEVCFRLCCEAWLWKSYFGSLMTMIITQQDMQMMLQS
jgi:hypothetical protein